ncbi:MAG: antibiotic biosynthesis monooxygenase [Anaerolineales bacterium]|nr:antibiotic biosynthesis monooxygenase [Anaerolineales bacterium]
MYIVHVHVHVKEGLEHAFKEVTLMNAENSVKEPGIARFDVLQRLDDPTKFILVEVYRTPEDPGNHKKTDHYKIWRDMVSDMMEEARESVKYDNVFPDDESWD